MSEVSSEVINQLPDNVNDQNNIENKTSYGATLRPILTRIVITLFKILKNFKQLEEQKTGERQTVWVMFQAMDKITGETQGKKT